VVLSAVLILFGFGATGYLLPDTPDRVTVLTGLRDDINSLYGYDTNGTPRINCGPCARFAILFRQRWNARFRDPVTIAFVMSDDGIECGHVALKFVDGSYFDGGNGVVSEQQLRKMFANRALEEMVEFDRDLLSRRVGGLDHERYPNCPHYSDAVTSRLIEKHLARLPRDLP
jgi:hypothetical protein